MKGSFPFMLFFFAMLCTLLTIYGSASAMDPKRKIAHYRVTNYKPSLSRSRSYSDLDYFASSGSLSEPNRQNTELSEFFDGCTEDSEMRAELYKYAIKELVEKHNQEKAKSKKNRQQKWVAVIVGAITTVTPMLVSIFNAMNSGDCDCPSA